MKKLLSVLMLIMILAISLVGCQTQEQQPQTEEEAAEPSIIHIYSTDETIAQKFEYVWEKHTEWKDRVEFVVLPEEGYAETIDALFEGPLPVEENEGTEEPAEPVEYKYPDIVIADSSVVSHFTESDKILAIEDLGIVADDLEQMYEYTLKEVTTEEGALKGITWKANPGAFVYRKSIALECIGYDDEDNVQSFLKDWETLADTARVVEKKTDGNIHIIDNVDLSTMEYDIASIDMSDINYFKNINLGRVFGYFCTADMIEKLDKACKGDGRGDWAVCAGPQNFVGDGTWLFAAKDCSDKEFAGEVMKALCTESDVLKKIFENDNDFVNNMRVMSNAYNSGKGKTELFGSGEYIAVYSKAAQKAGQE